MNKLDEYEMLLKDQTGGVKMSRVLCPSAKKYAMKKSSYKGGGGEGGA